MFTKNDLKTGMVVECKNGFRYMVITETVDTPEGLENGILISANGWLPLSKYNNDLGYGSTEIYFGCYGSFSVEKVYKSDIYGLTAMLKNANEIIWEREKEIYWSKVPVDTKILVRDRENESWEKAYFAKYHKGIIYAWEKGGTSFTKKQTEIWCYAKLYEGDK
jgi:hypothetical protein